MTQREEAALKSRIYAKLVDSCTERYIHEIKKKNEEIIRLRVVAIEKEIDKKMSENMTDFLIREKRPNERQQYLYGNQMLNEVKKIIKEGDAAVNNIEHDFGPTIKKIVDKNKEQEQEEVTAANLVNSITYISSYCHNLQSCNKCLIKKWCKEKRKKCPEEWTYTNNWSYENRGA